MKKILILMSVAMLFACNGHGKNEPDEPEVPTIGIVRAIGFSLEIYDENGVSLFSNQTLSKIDVEKIKIYTCKDGEYNLYRSFFHRGNPMRSDRDGFRLFGLEQESCIIVYVLHMELQDYYNDKDIVSSIIDWGNGVKDKIEARVDKRDAIGYFGYDQLWINGKLVWDRFQMDPYDDSEIKSTFARLVMSKGKTSSTAYSYLKALQ